jgi:hypothetical protein
MLQLVRPLEPLSIHCMKEIIVEDMVKSHGAPTAKRSSDSKQRQISWSLGALPSENLHHFCSLRRVLLSLLQHITLSTILSATARSSLEVHGTLLICPSLPRVAVDASVLTLDISTHTSEKELDHTYIVNKTNTHHDLPVGGLFQCLAR